VTKNNKFVMKKKITISEFECRANTIHGNKYDYSKVSFITVVNRVKIVCPDHGEFDQQAYSHLRGNGCPRCVKYNWVRMDMDEFLSKAKVKFGDKFDYSTIKLNRATDEIKLTCPIHGEIITTGLKFLDSIHGCKKCARDASKNKAISTEEFISRAAKIHDGKFDYSKSIYINRVSKIIITCPIHGGYETTPDVHLKPQGHDCPLCSVSGWDRTSWVKICEKNKNAIPSVYVVRCFNDEESFYKIGRTMRSIKARFLRPSVMPYNYELIHHIIDTPENIFNLEIDLHRLNVENRYTPNLQFPGSTECFSNFKLKE